MTDSWDETRVLVTGGSQGIGLGIARSFARVGARVVIAGRSRSRLEAARASLAREGMQSDTLVADVSDQRGCHQMAGDVVRLLEGLDVLCVNAGVYPERRIADLSVEDVDQVFDTNLKGTIFSIQACLPALAESRRGRVVVTSSITGLTTGFPGLSVYGASKAAQMGFVRSAALELAPLGITINAICPGSIRTEGLVALGEEAIATMRQCIPVGRLGEPEDIGETALFLAGAGAGFVTGQAITVDGGQTLPELPSN